MIMVDKPNSKAPKPRVVYDVKMPAYGYRDDKGQSRTVDVVPMKAAAPKLDCLANLPLGG